ncbi:MAG TPA: hypothetical protein VKO18_02155 [Terriglobia bacterium]|nr:hypothetical protein [Terriglobia bacterium]
MITNESEIRIALQAVLVSVLALYGFWGCAFVVLIVLLPWKPILAVGGYLAQPLVDWRIKKARDRHEMGIAQIEQELDAFLRTPKGTPTASGPAAAAKTVSPPKPSHPLSSRPLESFKPNHPAKPAFQDIAGTAQNLAATLAIPPVIQDHVRNLPQGVFHNMDLEVEEVQFQGDRAEAYVRFQSPNVTELVIRQRYVLRKSGDHWQVESRQPANGAGKTPPRPLPTGGASMRLS